MTRIVAGSAGGLSLQVPHSNTRPTSERVREALFSVLDHHDVLDGARVLDLYAGSGSLGLEAASRGAEHVVLVDRGRPAQQACRANVARLDLPATVQVVAASAASYLAGRARPVDLVFVDPPYDVTENDLSDVLTTLVQGWLARGATVVVERRRNSPEPDWPAPLQADPARRYGDTTLWVASYEPPAAGTTVGGMDTDAGQRR